MKKFVVAATIVLPCIVVANSGDVGSAEPVQRLATAAQVVQGARKAIPQLLWNRANCIVAISDRKQAVSGGASVKGVMSCRSGDRWSAPVFLQLINLNSGRRGAQAASKELDVLLLVMNGQGLQKLLDDRVTLGADASVLPGPVARLSPVDTDPQPTAEMLSYSREDGSYAGIDLTGAILGADESANHQVYGPESSLRLVLATSEISAPIQAGPFLAALGSSTPTGTTTAPEASTALKTPPSPSAATVPDADLRAQVVEIQRTFDRIVSESASTAAVGTAGAQTGDANATVVIDRRRLMQLRQQLEALLTAIDRKR